ncbi:GlxA family transcriptional regulator [Streptomyces avicenniae]|uniref:GlxA family transcriptional regulator n=1 Tax=Streptomyces avicenniae TaxID=500153 RepID=UPI00069A6389|nr:helix-turn-helix domain-containing protein [Streptomyces avicenniae]
MPRPRDLKENEPSFSHRDRHRVAVLVRDRMLPIELGIVHRILGRAAGPSGEPLYEVLTCALVPGEVRTDTDVTVNVAHGPALLAEADTVILPAAHGVDEELAPGALPAPLAAALAHIRPGTRIASICTGAFVLAAAGLLDGLRATTHWSLCDHLATLHPAVHVAPDILYTDETTATGRVLTSAGVASGIDLCLHLVRSDFGASAANRVARRTVVPPHREGGQAQYVELPFPRPGTHATGRARAWALDRLDRPLTLRELAGLEGMSVRTFTRRFREETGLSPQRWLTLRRLERARRLLEETDLPVDRVAERAGFGTAASLRQHMASALGVSPSAYRRTFRGIDTAVG